MNLAEKKVFIFDFDGTLVDSNKIKKDAFFQLRPNDTRFNDILKKCHTSAPESSRYILLKNVLKEYGSTNIEEEVNTLCDKYGNLVEQAAIDCPEMPGAQELLKTLASRVATSYLSSNTPEASLKKIVADRNLAHYFKNWFGYPRKKDDTIKEIFSLEELRSPNEIIVIGDGVSDKNSALSIGCDFFDVNKRPLKVITEALRNV